MNALYDSIGIDYSNLRKADPRIAAHIRNAIGDVASVLNVGAGTGSYEPGDLEVTALEPSAQMISQRPADAAQAVQGSAENIPFADDSFDAALAILTVHHWADAAKGLAEMRRVARKKIVILAFDPGFRENWLLDYWPQLAALDDAQMPPMDFYSGILGPVQISPLPVPHDCSDGFLYAYWRRPQAYLDPRLRKGSSSFWKIDGVDDGLARLERDLASGEWQKRYGDLLGQEQRDMGYRLLVADLA
ncbi:class I SAM-dependent methyltransferase [Alterisphingorhabdus coralli]|uniref:Class I SAM-dependent methyltransferase n=1 Tax=Alterisphingorhabdus coralli TaxID=3071408 RepID=A0AA97I0M6_9SPHN|nr:class I SAM-dependent methyltransferase [Parasphingorhabdus sp. SCSIO 66989]WOE75137.1 class I SAM-dependent methyltransferase [Parasphingorhabdus sp. SCSIO 66989]